MADREPLRVGPLVLRWTTGRKTREGVPLADSYVYRLAGGESAVIRPHPIGWSWGQDDDLGDWRGSASQSLGYAVERLRVWLTETGYLAQYRSRRRLLAWECERRAHHARQARLLVASPEAALRWRKAGAKYARWAERLRNG